MVQLRFTNIGARRICWYAYIRCGSSSASTSVNSAASQEGTIDPLLQYTPFGGIRKKPVEKKSIWHYSDRAAGKGYSDFSNTIYPNRPYIWPPIRKWFKVNTWIIVVGCTLLMLDIDRMVQSFEEFLETPLTKQVVPKAAEVCARDDPREPTPEDSEVGPKKQKPKRKHIGFRERKVMNYEDRIRQYSSPDKIFRYFATLKVVHDKGGSQYEVFMTPEDFVRSLTPGVLQPRNLGLDSFKVYKPEKYKHNFSDPDSIFYKLGEHASPRDFELAFKIFDVNGDGELDREEFHKIQTQVGQRHRDHITPGVSYKVQSNSALERYFFGPDGTHTLSAKKFLDFQAELYRDILKMEFNRRDALNGIDGRISELSFAQLLLLHAQIEEKMLKKMLKRVKRRFKDDSRGVSFDEVLNLFGVLYKIEQIDLALHFHKMAGVAIDGPMLQKVAKKITGIDLSDHTVDIVITLFDDNDDGKLSNAEFISIMKKRMRRGLERPKDTGLQRFGVAFWRCSMRALSDAPIYQIKH